MSEELYNRKENKEVSLIQDDNGGFIVPVEPRKFFMVTEYLGDRTESWVVDLEAESGEEIRRWNCKHLQFIEFKKKS